MHWKRFEPFFEEKGYKSLAKKTNNDLLETLINSFILEKDPEYKYDKYIAIIEGTERLKKVWGI
ncbi:MAG: hypothetical protein ACE5J9_04485 [Methanosarcinales archaeon]